VFYDRQSKIEWFRYVLGRICKKSVRSYARFSTGLAGSWVLGSEFKESWALGKTRVRSQVTLEDLCSF